VPFLFSSRLFLFLRDPYFSPLPGKEELTFPFPLSDLSAFPPPDGGKGAFSLSSTPSLECRSQKKQCHSFSFFFPFSPLRPFPLFPGPRKNRKDPDLFTFLPPFCPHHSPPLSDGATRPFFFFSFQYTPYFRPLPLSFFSVFFS